MNDFRTNYLKKAKRWASVLAWMPGVSAIFLSGSLAQGRGSKDSDIDFFIVAEAGQICTARFFVSGVLKCFGQLAHDEKNHAGKICPNHFITTDRLEIQEKDRYAAQLFVHNYFLAGDYQIWKSFVGHNSTWVQQFDQSFVESFPKTTITTVPNTYLTQKIEKWCKAFQRKRLAKQKRDSSTKVWITDTEIRLHPEPKNKQC